MNANTGKAAKLKQQAIEHYRSGALRDAYKKAVAASELDTRDAPIRNLAGAIANDIGAPSSAVKLLSESLEINSKQPNALYLLGNALVMLQLHSQAVAAFDDSLKLDPEQPDALLNKALAHRAMNDVSEAERTLRIALNNAPTHAGCCNALALILMNKNRADAAEEYARQAVDTDNTVIEHVITLAKILQKLKRFDEAEDVFNAAIRRRPNDTLLLCELGEILRVQRKFDKATELYERAIEVNPRSPKVLRAAADYFRAIKQYKKSIDLYYKVLDALENPDAALYNNMAIALREGDRFDESEEMYLKAADLDPDNAYAFNNLAILAMEMGKGPESIDYYEKALDKLPSYSAARSNMLFYMNYLSSYSPSELSEEHHKWPAYHANKILPGASYHANDPDPDRRLKIGMISADFCGHAVSYFIDGFLEFHDASQYEVHCFAAVPTPDLITQRLEGFADHFHYIHTLDKAKVVDLIREKEIDILIELSGHTAGNKLEILGDRPAPIQVTWIGYPNTTGLDTIDYRFVDHITDPVGEADDLHSEKLYRLPKCFTCYTPTATEPVSMAPPVVKNGYITFGSFNNASKISEKTVEVWSNILKTVPDSRLLLKSASFADEGTRERLRQRFVDQGIDVERLDMHGRMPMTEHVRFYSNVDIGLDPTPYNGTTTTCEALWMGVPVLALLGDRHAARVSGSLMTHVGLGDFVCETPDELYKKAQELAGKPEYLVEIRETMRDRLKRSDLCNAREHTKAVEVGLREMWQEWCAKSDSRAEERSNNGWPADAPYKPVLPVLNGFGNGQFIQIIRCLGAMNAVKPLSDVHPLGMTIFPPSVQARDWWGLVGDEEVEQWSDLKLSFAEVIKRIWSETDTREERLMLRSWTHLDYLGPPFLPSADHKLWIDSVLSDDFDIRNVFIVSHPLAQWSYYVNNTTASSSLTLSEFLIGYMRLAQRAAKTKFLKVEDWSTDPSKFIETICEQGDLPFDPDFTKKWMMNDNVTGSTQSRTLMDRMSEPFLKPWPARISAEEAEHIKGFKEYREIVALLGYEMDYPLKGES